MTKSSKKKLQVKTKLKSQRGSIKKFTKGESDDKALAKPKHIKEAKAKSTRNKKLLIRRKGKVQKSVQAKASEKTPVVGQNQMVAETSEKPNVPKLYSAYTLEQFKQYKDIIYEWKRKSADLISQLLTLNQTPKTGNKAELLVKLADGIVLGKIPKCPLCFGGNPRFDQETGNYYCPGYRDDECFVNCRQTLTQEQIVRQPWIMN